MKKIIVVTILLLAGVCACAYADVPGYQVKWSQPILWDDVNQYFLGYDVLSTCDLADGDPCVTAADDWLCGSTNLLSDFHWWGSYLTPGEIDGFYIAIHEDIPAGGAYNFSHPGQRLWNIYVPFAQTAETLKGVDQSGHEVYQYNVFLDPADYFLQEEGNIYWLAIKADTYETDTEWGWHTGPPAQLDTALQMPLYDQVNGVYDPANAALVYGDLQEPYDLAFELTFVPEPGSIVMMVSGVLGAAGFAWRRFRR
jgi:hypothetical protein